MSNVSNSRSFALLSGDSDVKDSASPNKKLKVDENNVLGDNTHQLPISCDDPPKGENISKQPKPIYYDDQAEAYFVKWCKNYDIRYRSEEERCYRFNIFKKTVEDVARENREYAKIGRPCMFILNETADKTTEEIVSSYFGLDMDSDSD